MDRRITALIIAIFTSLILYSNIALAISFTASVDPAQTEVGNKSVTVNFTITHSNTTANITQLNITLPSSFTYAGSIGEDATTSSNSTILSRQTGSTIKWLNTTSPGFVSGTNRFFFQIDTPSSNATFSFIINVTDTAGISTGTNITFKLLDTTAPQFTSNTTSPATSTKYAKNITYTFSATWTDKITVGTVLIEHNFTGTLTNYTMSATGSSYSYNFTDLAAAYHVWRMYANDSINNVNTTDQYGFNVSKADNILEIFLAGARNSDVQTTNESALNVTANSSAGTVSIYRNSNLIVSGATPQSTQDSLASGSYTYKANATGNQNYSDNSTGISFVASLSGPAPKWSGNTTSLPSAYSNSSTSTFEATWNDKSDANGFSVAIIEINHTGSFVNYTMYRVPGTNRSQFNATVPGGITRWKIYANNSQNSFNTTPLWSASVTQAKPKITLSSNLGWLVDVGGETNATCYADTGQVTVKLYRDGTAVSIPDKATLTVGKYLYKCNNTATQNYSSTGETQTLEIQSFTKYLSIVNFTAALKTIELVENSSTSVVIEIKNTGNLSDTVTFAIENINSSWYAINTTSAALPARGGSGAFHINFSVGFVEIRDYSGRFKVAGGEETLYSNFTLRVLPGNQTKLRLNDAFILYRTEFLKFELEFNESKAQNKNITNIEESYAKLKAKIEEAGNKINQGDYSNIEQIFDEIRSLLDSSKQALSQAQTVLPLPLQQIQESGKLFTYIIIAVAVAAGGILAYLFWPTKETPAAKPAEIVKKVASHSAFTTIKETITNLINKVKKLFKREPKFKYEYKGE